MIFEAWSYKLSTQLKLIQTFRSVELFIFLSPRKCAEEFIIWMLNFAIFERKTLHSTKQRRPSALIKITQEEQKWI